MYFPSTALLALQEERTRAVLSRRESHGLVSRQHQDTVIHPPIRRLLIAVRLAS